MGLTRCYKTEVFFTFIILLSLFYVHVIQVKVVLFVVHFS